MDKWYTINLQELSSYLSLSTSTSVVVDKSPDGEFLRIDFDMRYDINKTNYINQFILFWGPVTCSPWLHFYLGWGGCGLLVNKWNSLLILPSIQIDEYHSSCNPNLNCFFSWLLLILISHCCCLRFMGNILIRAYDLCNFGNLYILKIRSLN